MRKATCFLTLICSSLCSFAATNITSPTVSGHWTLAGSPYKIFNNISIDLGQSLIIDPGVEVVFQGLYSLSVSGSFKAVGSSSQRIRFHVQDTTGWHNDASPAGGWRGIRFEYFLSSVPPVAAFEYCDVTDIKSGGSAGGSTIIKGTFDVGPNWAFAIKSCNFYHNISVSAGQHLVNIWGNVDFYNCNFFDNYAQTSIIEFPLAKSKIMSSCNIYNNSSAVDIIRVLPTTPFSPATMLIEQCNIYQNQSTTDNHGAIISTYGHDNPVTIRKNKIHHNTIAVEAAVNCNGGTVDINGNLICNNVHLLSGTCGPAEGGGGIRLHSSLGYTNYTVRNNIIANNYSAFLGGGIYVWKSNVKIINNTIINNSVGTYGFARGGGLELIQDTFQTYVKNNIIYNNQVVGIANSPNIHSLNNSKLVFENNWLQRPLSLDIFAVAGCILYYGDTLSNIVGTAPNLVSPTITATATENALTANFNLLNTSHCINTGDTASAQLYTTDYNNNNRLTGSNVDIGACEFNSFCPDTISGITGICAGSSTALSHPVAGGVWSSPHSSHFVSVNPSTGFVTGIAGGIATIYYSVGGCLASKNVKVYSLPVTILGPANVCIASTVTLVSYPVGGSWTSTNSAATISPAGILTGLSSGIDTILYTVSNLCGTRTISKSITINTPPMPITGPSMLCMGDSVSLTDTGAGIWSSYYFVFVSVNHTTGIVTGLLQGLETITYTIPATGCSAYFPVTVNPTPPAITGLHVVCMGGHNDLNNTLGGGNWSSSDITIAGVDNISGLVSGISLGNTTITYMTPFGCYTTYPISVISCIERVDEISNSNEIKVYPNPTNGTISISTPYATGTIQIQDIAGKRITEKNVTCTVSSFNLQTFPRGIYFAVWSDGAGTKATQKIVVE